MFSFVLCITDRLVGLVPTDIPFVRSPLQLSALFPLMTSRNVHMLAVANDAQLQAVRQSTSLYPCFASSIRSKYLWEPNAHPCQFWEFFPADNHSLRNILPFTASILVIDTVLSAQRIHLRPIEGLDV